MYRIAIIGSAGRGTDAPKINKSLYAKMVRRAIDILCGFTDEITLVSGGAAFSDHVAVSLHLMKHVALELHLPAPWNHDNMCFVSHGYRDTGAVANYWHCEFSKKLGDEVCQSLYTIDALITMPPDNFSYQSYNGFKERNLAVGKVDTLIAFTFSSTGKPKPGGTAHTWANSKATNKIHIDLGEL